MIEQNKRIEYIDILKGIAIITIVWRHIADLGVIGHVNCLFLSVLNSFHVPLFFFLSGLFAFKRMQIITLYNAASFVKEKAVRLLSPFVIFGGLYHFTVCNLAKFPGYWFLPALFYCMLIGCIYKIFERFCGGGKCRDLILIMTTWGIACILWIFKIDIPYYLGALKQFPFFMIGYYVGKYEILSSCKLKKEYIIVFLLVCYVIAFAVMYSRKMLFNFPAIFAIPILIATVAKNSNKIPSWVGYIGRHTLEIYVLHFFLIPSLFPIGDFILMQHSYNQNFIPILLICIVISIPIIMICVLISKIICMSRYLGYFCFGQKIKDERKTSVIV